MGNICAYNDGELFFHYTSDEKPNKKMFSMHAHEMCEILVVCSGKGHFLVEGTKYPVFPGAVFIMREGETHKMAIDTSVPYERFGVHFEKALIESIDPSGELLIPFHKRKLGKGNAVQFPFIEEKIRMIKKLDTRSSKNRIRATLLSFILSALLDISDSFSPDDMIDEDDIIGRNFEIIDFVNTNLSSDLSLEYISSKFYISKSQLNRTFKKITGSTLWDYIIIKRLLLAKSYMKNGASISEAYKRCGFNDYSSFYRAYKKRFGESPKNAK